MKKICCMLLALALVLSLGACGQESGNADSDKLEGSVQELLKKVTEGVTDPEMSLMEPEINDENFSWYFFIDPIQGAEAAVSEPAIGSIPHFVGLLRVPEGTDAETVRGEIEANLNPVKWVCVEAEKTAVVARGDVILVVMSGADSVSKAVENFNAL